MKLGGKIMMRFASKAVLLMGVGLVSSALSLPANAEAVKLSFGHILDTESAVHKAAVVAAETASSCSNGALEIEIFPGGQLGNESALNNAIRVGGVDIANSGTFFLSNEFPLIGISTLPYIFRDRDHALTYIASDVMEDIMNQWHEKTGQYLMSAYYGSAFHIMANSAYPNPDDMKGQRIRTPDSPAWTVFPSAVGAIPTPISFGEVYLALQQGLVDGSTMSLPLVYAQKFYEVVDYMNLTYHSFEISFMIVGEHVRKQLDDDQWACLQKAADSYAMTAQELNLEAEDSLRETMTNADMVEFIDVDVDAYQKATESVIDDKIRSGEMPEETVAAIRAL
jgi:tripartite ATP-independent transporter DctP family solute receptor